MTYDAHRVSSLSKWISSRSQSFQVQSTPQPSLFSDLPRVLETPRGPPEVPRWTGRRGKTVQDQSTTLNLESYLGPRFGISNTATAPVRGAWGCPPNPPKRGPRSTSSSAALALCWRVWLRLWRGPWRRRTVVPSAKPKTGGTYVISGGKFLKGR